MLHAVFVYYLVPLRSIVVPSQFPIRAISCNISHATVAANVPEHQILHFTYLHPLLSQQPCIQVIRVFICCLFLFPWKFAYGIKLSSLLDSMSIVPPPHLFSGPIFHVLTIQYQIYLINLQFSAVSWIILSFVFLSVHHKFSIFFTNHISMKAYVSKRVSYYPCCLPYLR